MQNRDDELGGLWVRQSQAGMEYMYGKLTIGDQEVAVVVFKNSWKRAGDRSPDYRVYRSQPREDQRQSLPERGQSTHDASRRAGGYGKREPTSNFDDLDDEVPF